MRIPGQDDGVSGSADRLSINVGAASSPAWSVGAAQRRAAGRSKREEYAWDHISHNRAWLRRLRGVTLSGGVQTVSAALLMLSGVVLLLYGDQVWPLLRTTHHVLTYSLLASIGLHYLFRKT